MISIANGSHRMPTTKSTLFAVRKDGLDTKEGTGKSMENVYGMAKTTSQAEVTLKNEKSSL